MLRTSAPQRQDVGVLHGRDHALHRSAKIRAFVPGPVRPCGQHGSRFYVQRCAAGRSLVNGSARIRNLRVKKPLRDSRPFRRAEALPTRPPRFSAGLCGVAAFERHNFRVTHVFIAC